MKNWRYLAFVVGIFGLGDTALACRGPFAHRYVFLDLPPARLPPGAVLLAVAVSHSALIRGTSEPAPVRVRITEAKEKRLVGQDVTIRPGIFTSCGHWSESQTAKHVVGFLSREKGQLVITPVVYRSNAYRTVDEDFSIGIRKSFES